MLCRLADLAHRRPRRILLAAALWGVVAAVFGAPVVGLLSSSSTDFEDAASESVAAREQLERASGASPSTALVVLVEADRDIRSGPVRARVERLAAELRREPAVARVSGFFENGSHAFVSRDGRATYLAVSLRTLPSDEAAAVARRLADRLAGDPRVTVGGPLLVVKQIDEQVEHDLVRAELIAFPLLFLLSVLVFRGLVAALLPPLGGLLAIVSTFLALRGTDALTPVSLFAINLVTGLGLGLAIDYSLLVVSRYREELARVGPGAAALRRTVMTAGRTVLFSALIVAAALASLLAFPQPFLRSMAIGGSFGALFSAVNAVVVLPPILALLGPRVNALAPAWLRRAGERTARPETWGPWYRLAQTVMGRAGLVAAGSAALLIALGLPALQLRLTSVDASVLPKSAGPRHVHDALASRFAAGSSPIYLAVAAPPRAEAELAAYAAKLRHLPDVASVATPAPLSEHTWRIDLLAREPALADATKSLVRTIRTLGAPFPVRAGGETAAFLDVQASLRSHLPLGLGILGATTVLLLFGLTGSILLPLKSLLMNLLSLSATFGILVFVFQDRGLQWLFRYERMDGLESTQLILIAAVALALSTDYGVFLLSRIKEAYDGGASNREAVARGLERTGRIVTSAALLFCVAIGIFSTSKVVYVKELGVGIALAVAIDATIIRALLVPSLMRLLGGWNWWAPKPLARLHPRLGLTESRASTRRPSRHCERPEAETGGARGSAGR